MLDKAFRFAARKITNAATRNIVEKFALFISSKIGYNLFKVKGLSPLSLT